MNNNKRNSVSKEETETNNKSIINTFIGIDVGKFYIDSYHSLTGEYYLKVENNKKSIIKFIENLKKDIRISENNNSLNFDNVLVVIDLTGNYEVLCRDLFYNNGFKNIFLADGKKIKYFKKSKKFSTAKTDKSDAFVLSLYGKENLDNLVLYTKNTNEQDLKELQKLELRISDLKHFLVKEKNRLQAPNIPNSIAKDIKETIKFLEKKISNLEDESLKIIERNRELKIKFNILKNQHGIGNITAKTLLSFLPELGQLNKNKISAISGTAPIARDSGTIKGYRTTRGCGRKTIKKALFMSVLSMIRKDNSHLNIFYKNLINKGKSKMTAYVACMRKLIIYLNSLIKKEYYEKGIYIAVN